MRKIGGGQMPMMIPGMTMGGMPMMMLPG